MQGFFLIFDFAKMISVVICCLWLWHVNGQNVINLGLVEVEADATLRQGTNSIIEPGALAIGITPPGNLDLTVTATGSPEWGGLAPKFDVLIFSDAQWQQYKGPNVGSVGTFGVISQNVQTVKFDMPIAQQAAGPGKYWVLLYNQPGSGADPPAFSTINFSWAVRFYQSAPTPLSGGRVGVPRCPADGPFAGFASPIVSGPHNDQVCSGVCTYMCAGYTCTITVVSNTDNVQCGGQPSQTVPCTIQSLCDASPLIACPPPQKAACLCDLSGGIVRKVCSGATAPTPVGSTVPCAAGSQPACDVKAQQIGGCPPGFSALCVCAATSPTVPQSVSCVPTQPNPSPNPFVPTPVVPTPVNNVPSPVNGIPTPFPNVPTPGVPTPPGVPTSINPPSPLPTPPIPVGMIACPVGAQQKCMQSTIAICQSFQTATCFCTQDGFTVTHKFCQGNNVPPPTPVGAVNPPAALACPSDLQTVCEDSLSCDASQSAVCQCENGSITKAECAQGSDATSFIGRGLTIVTTAGLMACL